MNAVIGVDLGATLIKSALVDEIGRSVIVDAIPTPNGVEPAIEAVASAIAALQDRALEHELLPAAIGLAVPGLVDEAHGSLIASANLGWSDVPLAALLSARVGLPVSVAHDARSAALAESLLGAAQGCRDLLLLVVGTGIGAAIVIDGEARPGHRGWAGEFGHITAGGAARCRCGRRGCLETVASCHAIERRYRRATGTSSQASDIAALASDGDGAAERVWADAIDALARSIVNAAMLVDPQMIVIGGGIVAAGPHLLDPLNARIAELMPWDAPRARAAGLGPSAGCLGAALSVLSEPAARDGVARGTLRRALDGTTVAV
jgi:glucokinase